MDIYKLRYFHIFSQTGSLVKAAQILNISQPALSKSLQSLQSEVGRKLIEPDGRGLKLTADGEQFQKSIAEILNTWNKITFEYILFDKFNDFPEDAAQLYELTLKVPSFVNIIEYNKVEGVEFHKAKSEKRDAFVNYLRNRKVNVAVRRSRGKDIDAACGQLANKEG